MNDFFINLANEANGIRKTIPPVWQFFNEEIINLIKLIIQECDNTCLVKIVNNYNINDSIMSLDIKMYGTKNFLPEVWKFSDNQFVEISQQIAKDYSKNCLSSVDIENIYKKFKIK